MNGNTMIMIAALLMTIGGIFSACYLLFSRMEQEGRRTLRLRQLHELSVGEANAVRTIDGRIWFRFLERIGVFFARSGLLSAKTLGELQQTLSSVSFLGTRFLPVFIGAKAVTLVVGIVVGWLIHEETRSDGMLYLVLSLGAPMVGLLAPDFIVKRMQAHYLRNVDQGIPDALDMLVICAEAGLPIEAAIGRVGREMTAVNRSVANEFRLTAQEMGVASDRRDVFLHFGERTNLSSMRRIGSALNQTLQAGSSVTQALRVLSVEMRKDALTEYEARAARLPVLLTLPMILFILPVVFLVVGGPAAVTVMHALGR
ncbi:type II secretion system protein [Gluconacetobacter diazotrophicus PA1 5]|uniref:type II secretion system F family protein n=1 Tax=Gluconacetobacter diazotrophicus TaxID=33996 RepID=UPI000173CACE|nr:type II secretion system F family protein [Gluconacetobacter diazotrophicus]ACI53216.1 type II secretion system protein [Gluconacetobacter diazotrophicus PA1 5]